MSNLGFVNYKPATLHDGAEASGHGEQLNVTGYSAVVVQVIGITTASLVPQVTLDPTEVDWDDIQCVSEKDGSILTAITANGSYIIPTPGKNWFRLDLTYTAGTIYAYARAITFMPGTTLADIDIQGIADISTATNQTAQSTLFGAVTETAPATDTASSGLNGRLQRVAQRITSLIALIPTALGASGGLKVEEQEAVTVPTQITKTVAAAGTPEALAADGTFFQSATYIGIKAARTNNAGTVYLGIGATNDTQIIPIAPGEQGVIQAPPGQKFDLNDFYLDVETAGDGLGLIYS